MRYTYMCRCLEAQGEEALRWIEEHSMEEHGDNKIACPHCGGEANQYLERAPQFYFKGACYERKNMHDCKRQMDLHALKENDPYGEHRLPGAKDDLIKKYEKTMKSKKSKGPGSTKVEPCIGMGCIRSTTSRCPSCLSPLCVNCDTTGQCPCEKHKTEPPTREELVEILKAKDADK